MSNPPAPEDLDAIAERQQQAAAAWEALQATGGIEMLAQTARRWGLSAGTVNAWRGRRPDFPDPVGRAGRYEVWLAADLDHWRATPRKPGRPRKPRDDDQ